MVSGLRRRADSQWDVLLLARFLELVRLPLSREAAYVPGPHAASLRLLLRTLRFLRSCRFHPSDVCSILGHAGYYFDERFSFERGDMDPAELGHVLVLTMFIAHCYVVDEPCELHIWHRYLFKKYSDLHTLNLAVLHMLKLRNF